ncbi:MAG: CocE/NonD family hydrolase [Deltaproteobacteria bacterium]|nr:CocE/NonD family hydrolase [Deltaproteobacteria bacterium]
MTLRDGARLCTDIFRPDAEGEKFPALIAWAAYGKSVQSLKTPPLRPDCLLFDHTREAGDLEYFVPRGYVYVIPDPRGVGKSDGEFDGWFGPQEQEDVYDLIEWVAQQPWCDGQVGMIGLSYFGIMQMLAAAQQPPHLKAIMPISVLDSAYRLSYTGGILDTFSHAFLSLIPTNKEYRSYAEIENSAEELQRKMKERWENDPDIRSVSYFLRELTTWPPRFNPMWLDTLMHPLDGEFWDAKSANTKWHKIQVPAYMTGHWNVARQWDPFGAFMDPDLDVPKKVMIWGVYWLTVELPLNYYNEEYLRWYDYWFKGVDTGIMDEPPITIFVMGVNRFRYENEWPLARTRWTKLYMRSSGRLSTEPEEKEDVPPDGLVHIPPMISKEVPSVTYTTAPLSEPLEVTGPLALRLYASIDAEDANFIGKLYDVGPGGARQPVSAGYLKASHRTLIPEKSRPGIPVHDHTKEVPVKPGEITEYVIEFSAKSMVFQPGHKLELELTTMDYNVYHESLWSKVTSIGPLPNARVIEYKFYRDAKYRSHLLLPVIPETDPDLWLRPLGITIAGERGTKHRE